jgi:hypothetical protein
MRNLVPYFSLVGKGWFKKKATIVPIDFGPPQAKGIGESSDHLCKSYTKNSLSSSFFYPRHHYPQPYYPPYPYCFYISSFPQFFGYPWYFSTTHYVHPTFGLQGQPNQEFG